MLVGGDAVIAEGDVDLAGSLLFRNVEPGSYTLELEDAGTVTTEDVDVPGFDQPPPQEFFADQQIGPGYGYVTVRDGTTLSVNVVLPGDVSDGPFPTVVEYSAYDPSDPTGTGVGLASLATALGYAWVGVNMRGSGCSGGSFDYFEPIQATDGYDAIEAIAAQPWVQGNKVGMVGVSYPGISQLYVAAAQPPSLLAITPLSVVDSSALYTLYPGGILNDGFALPWAIERDVETAPFGQQWSRDADRGWRRDVPGEPAVAAAESGPGGTDPRQPVLQRGGRQDGRASACSPRSEVPVFLAGAWQDEQTGGHFATMLDGFTGTDHFYASLTNGLHTESLSAGIAPRWLEFLDLYVAKRVPSLDTLRTIAPVLGEAIWDTDQITLRDDRFVGATYDEALATFEADAPIEVLFEEGAGGPIPLAPMPAWSESFASWPIPGAMATSWYLGPDGTLGSDVSVEPRSTSYVADPANVPEGYFDESTGGNIWSVDAEFDWVAEPSGTAASFVSDPFIRDTIVMGSGSADLWIAADAPDTDVEVTLSEMRPDGTEVLVQSGWLRASHRALDEAASTALHPVQTHREEDAAPLPADGFTPIRVDIYPFAHPFRAGSQLRVTVDAPGGNRQIWHWDTISDGETVTIAHDIEHPSRIVLSTLTGIDIPDELPACGALRGQPCRDITPCRPECFLHPSVCRGACRPETLG